MTITETVELINKMGADVDFALGYLQEQKFQQAIEVGYRFIFCDMENYKAAVDLLIERGKNALLEQRCSKIYESACMAEPLLKQAISNCIKIGEIEAKGSVWATHIKAYWETVVLPLLQTNPPAQAEATPQRGRRAVKMPRMYAEFMEAKKNGIAIADFAKSKGVSAPYIYKLIRRYEDLSYLLSTSTPRE